MKNYQSTKVNYGGFNDIEREGELKDNRCGEKRPRVMAGTWYFHLAFLLFLCTAALGQTPRSVDCPQPLLGRSLLSIPEIKSDQGYLKALLFMSDNDKRVMWDGGSRCATQYMRFFHGRSLKGAEDPQFSGSEPIPGPTFRARVGDLIEIQFQNLINTKHFPNTLDRGELTDGCDKTFANSGGKTKPITHGDSMPNCLHGSSTANVHFHGTHTTPSTTGDNVLLFIRPAMGGLSPADQKSLQEFYGKCEQKGPPALWKEMPDEWQAMQKAAVAAYDNSAPYNGQSPPKGGPPVLPHNMQLSPVNNLEISQNLWPQYHIGYFPYCFRLPKYVPPATPNGPVTYQMGQSPGTHWYHAHKHGSTALNVANGLTGAFIIEGQYDDDLRKYYSSNPKWKLQEEVLVLQQLATVLNLTVPGKGPHTRGVPLVSVNGRYSPVITMLPGQIQLWRFVNGTERDAAHFMNFTQRGGATPCSGDANAPCVHWRQTAQDGVQFKFANYQNTPVDNRLYLAPGNRADFLVQAPSAEGTYDLKIEAGLCRFDCNAKQETLLTVVVKGTPIVPPMPFIAEETDFPQFPAFLADIPASDIFLKRNIVFQDNNGLRINGKQFDDHKINEAMLLNSAEEWKVVNLDATSLGNPLASPTKEHPFHIHVNPFQITEVFQPLSPKASDPAPDNKCYADPTKPETWKQCDPPQKDFVWWDTFAIPAARTDTLACTSSSPSAASACPSAKGSACAATQVCTGKLPGTTAPQTLACKQDGNNNVCPDPNGTPCSSQQACTVDIPGYFRMRSRFVDFPGQYVLHCHILTHEDRGMMQLIEVVPDTTLYTHH